MPIVHHVKKARADNNAVKRGDAYYWWKFAYSDKQYSKTYPRRSQLTQSDYKGCVYDLQDSVSDYEINNPIEFNNMISALSEQVEDMREQAVTALGNMKENLHVAPNGILLKNRIASCESTLSALGSLDWDEEGFEDNDEDFDLAPVVAAMSHLDLDKQEND